MLLFSGCAATRKVEPEYRPLKTMSERPWYASFLGGESTITTIGDTVYIGDLEAWLRERPPHSARYDAIMLHEMVHAQRQLKMGVSRYIRKYLTEQDFRWAEEQLGWYVQIKMYQHHGLRVIPQGIAKTLAGYNPQLISYEKALKWVNDVIRGRWTPEAELPKQLR